MSILDNLKTCYEGPDDSLGSDFIKPCIKECILYKRETGWFKSSAIRAWGDSLTNIIENKDAKIEIIAYPQIDRSTKIALDNTLNSDDKEKIIKKYSQNVLLKVLNIDAKRNIHNWEIGKDIGETLSYLIADGKLEIRFATCINHNDYQVVPDDADENTLTHGKRGYFNFPCGTTVSFNGSANESHAGLMTQGENFDVYDSREEGQSWKVEEHKTKIDATWDGERKGYKIEKVSRELLNKIKIIVNNHKKNDKKTQIPSKKVLEKKETETAIDNSIPDFFWKHKKDAIEKFLEKEKGILEMATGTGKTSTALEIVRLLIIQQKIDKVIICPNVSKTLCYQWENETIEWKSEYNISRMPLFKHFDKHKDMQKFLDRQSGILIVNRKPKKLKSALENCNLDRTLIIQDEVHGFGSEGMKEIKGLHKKSKYTLGLSATPSRIFEPESTKFIFDELGSVIFKFNLDKAILAGVLCPFNYHPLKVEFTSEERKKRQNITAHFQASKKGEAPPMTEFEYRNRMANVKKRAENKTYVFAEFIRQHPEMLKNSIIFCDTQEQAKSLGEYIHHYTTRFSNYFGEGVDIENLGRLGKTLDCVLSCHILSEGIDIPCLENIFILASPFDKRETIQRIGRCLRTDKNNVHKVANVIDFVCYNDIESDNIVSTDKERMEWLIGDSKLRKENG